MNASDDVKALLRKLPLITLLLAGVLQSVAGQVQPALQTPNRREQRRQTYAELCKKVFAGAEAKVAERDAVNSADAQRLDEMTARLHELLVAEIEETLAEPEPSAQNVAKAVKRLLGRSAISEWDAATTNTPVAEFVRVGGVRTLVVAYGMLRGGGAIPKTRSYLEFYAPENGVWRLKAQANPDFDGCTFSAAAMDAGLPDQAWFLAWGKTYGDPSSSMQLRLYAFDGAEVKTLWRRDDLPYGKVAVTRISVELDYEKKYKSDEWAHEMLFITVDGLK